VLQNMKNSRETRKKSYSFFSKFSRNILMNIGKEATPKRSPKRRGPA
jgi:hypothetical protein